MKPDHASFKHAAQSTDPRKTVLLQHAAFPSTVSPCSSSMSVAGEVELPGEIGNVVCSDVGK